MDLSQELKNYLDNMGRLKQFPTKRKYKILALIYLVSKFQRNIIYTEKEVNEILDKFHTFNDRCILRRELYNNRFIGRLKDCSQYWMEEEQPSLDSFNLFS